MINRNNYEEYLLMYLDGELSPKECSEVTQFLESNPDLSAELELLQQTILPPGETIEFNAKETLYKKDSGINLANYTEYFLLYIDDELTATEKGSVETFVLQNPLLQQEFTCLKETILPADAIIFPGKASLYKKEERKRPVIISLRWASMAAAAVVISVIALVVFNNNKKMEAFAVKPASTPANTRSTGDKTQPVIPETKTINTVIALENTKNSTNKNIIQPIKRREPQSTKLIPEIPTLPNQEQRSLAAETPVRVNNPVASQPSINTFDEPGETKTDFTAVNSTNNIIQPAVYTEELDTEKDNNLYVGALQINSDKVRGFFRKATRFLSSKIKNNEEDNDGKVKIANMEVNKIK